MELKEGQLVTPTLRLVRLLGRGGMGSVWVAEHLALQTQVAVKFLSAESATSPESIERFRQEATAAAQIRSPHVVQTLDHGVLAEGMPFIVLELLEGMSVGELIDRSKQLEVGLVVRIVTQTCKALAKAHAQGIVHRDIKPDNLFVVDSDGEPFLKVLDFGIAKKSDPSSMRMTSTNSMIGTPYYMSPEQAFSSKHVDARADLWSLAVVAYHALTGEVPFDGETVGAICVAIDRGVFAPPSKHRAGLPPTLDAWFKRAFLRNIDQRFGSARELADSFAVAAGEESAGPRSQSFSFPGSSLPSPPLPLKESLSAVTSARSSSARPHWLLPASAAGVVVLCAVVGMMLLRAPTTGPANAGAPSLPPAPSALVAPTTAPTPPVVSSAAALATETATAPVASASAAPATTATGRPTKGARTASPPPSTPPATPPPTTPPPTTPPPTTKPQGAPASTGVDRGF